MTSMISKVKHKNGVKSHFGIFSLIARSEAFIASPTPVLTFKKRSVISHWNKYKKNLGIVTNLQTGSSQPTPNYQREYDYARQP